MPARIGKQAVVVGAGMAGLAAARSLADFFERVIVLENDALPKEAIHRPGTPQSKHSHALLAGGLQALNRLFSGFEANLSEAGAVPLRILEKYPRALLPFGDAICRFNPIYGQGMSVAALETDVLNQLLTTRSAESDGLAGLATAFFRGAERLIDTPWWTAAVPDFADPRTEGQRPSDLEETFKFFPAHLKLAAEDVAVHKLFLEVQNLLKPRSEYRDPELVRRVKVIAGPKQDRTEAGCE